MGKSLFGSKSKSKNYATPWEDALPYILGDEEKGIKGFLPEAGRLFGQGGWNDQMQEATKSYFDYLESRPQDISNVRNAANQVFSGMFDTNISPINQIGGVPAITRGDVQVGTITPMMLSGVNARSLQGNLDPSESINKLLSGQINNQYLDPIADSIISKITRNTTENIFPQIRGGAIASNQYGGSREGIAEGLATSRMNQDIAGALAPLYGSAFENAQNRMQGTAEGLNAQALAMADANAYRDFMSQNQNVGNLLNAQQFNVGTDMDAQKTTAGNLLNAQQFNANLGLQNNAQRLGANTSNLSNRLQGLNLFNIGNDLADNTYQNYIQSLMQPQNLDWANLAQYYNVIAPTAQTYSTQRGTQTQQPGLIPSILGTIAGIGGIASGFGARGGINPGMTNFSSGGGGFMPRIEGSSSFMSYNPYSFLGG